MYNLILLLIFFLSGCSSLSSIESNKFDEPSIVYLSTDSQKDKARKEAEIFFSEYPFYLFSPQKENELYEEFMRILKTNDNRNLSMHDALMLAHEHLK
ncbi:hypothetical protein [Citrobacter sp. wls826]|uniref:hypothetical protein n=1 Tax=Citrobacter sp. wls826 TaxID=2576415 RepID=UPI0010C9A641|nr:hypothetical protein FDW87_00105 [Citrobacter sp. wls826]TKV30122.1 hypothetical protein FDX20_27275 [Citrobacter sp. TBCS-11]